MEPSAVEETISPQSPQSPVSGLCMVDEMRDQYRNHAQAEHGSIINPITGEEVDIMQQCVNLQIDGEAGHDVDDTGAYREVVADFAEQLPQGITAWVALRDGQYQKGHINRVNTEDKDAVTYDFQYVKNVIENGKKVDKVFIKKDLSRVEVKTRHVLVKGDPAGGKSTFAKQLLTWIMRSEEFQWLVPVMVRTIDLIRCKASFVEHRDILDQYLEMHYESKGLYRLFRHAKAEGRLLIILDGFDEAGALEHTLTSHIEELLVNECFLVLTSRDMGATFDSPAFARFRCVRVKELNSEQQRQVISRRLGAEDRIEHFCTQLTLNPALSLMARNPLLLNVTLAVFEACGLEQDASLNRGKVYSVALDGMLGNIEKAKAYESESVGQSTTGVLRISAQALRTVLRSMAYLAHTRHHGDGVRDFKIDLISRAIETSGLGAEFTMAHWKEIEDIVKKGRLPVLAWFVEDGVDTFRFAHLTFQEFLCAEQCLQASLRDEDFVDEWRSLVCPGGPEDIIRRGWWQQTLQMYCDLASSSEAKSPSGKGLDTALGESFLRLSDDGFSELRLSPHVNDNNILTIVSMLQMNSVIKKLSLGDSLSSQGVSTLYSLKLGSLQSLCLSGNAIGPEGCKSIAVFIESSGAPLEELGLANNIICQGAPRKDMPPPSELNPTTGHYRSHLVDLQGFSKLLSVIQKHTTLRHVDLRGNFLNLEAGQMLSATVLANQKLETVCGFPLQEIRGKTCTEVVLTNNPFFLRRVRLGGQQREFDLPESFLSTGDTELLLELLLQFPQPGLKNVQLDHQALGSDADGVEQLFAKLGDVIAAAEVLESVSLKGFWDCGVAAGAALGRRIKEHPRLKTLDVCAGSLDLSMIVKADLTLVLGGSSAGFRDCGAGILSELLPPAVRKLDIKGMGVGASGYKALSRCAHLQEINGIRIEEFKEDCTILDLSENPLQSSGAVACVIAKTVSMPNLTHLNLSGSNLTSKSHCHVLTPVIGGSSGTGCDGGCDCSHFRGTNAYAKCAQCDLDFCSTCCMSECPMVALAEALDRLPHLVSLKIANCAFQGGRNGPVRSHRDVAGHQALGAALARHSMLTDLDISANYFDGPGFPHLAQGVALMPALQTLRAGKETSSQIHNFQSWLTLDHIKPEPEWIEAELLILARAIARNKHLRSLDLSNRRQTQRYRSDRMLGMEIVRALVDSMQNGSVADGLQDDVIEDAEPAAADSVCISPRKVTLDSLEIDGVVFPFGELQNGTLSSLDISSENPMQRANLAPLFALAVGLGSSLSEINFMHQDFGDMTESVVSAVSSIAGHGVLQKYNTVPLSPARGVEVLDLSQTPVMTHGICIMASTTIPTGNITEMNLSSCGMNSAGLAVLLAAMLRRQTVTSLDVSNQSLCSSGAQELASFLRLDKRLQVLRARRIDTPGFAHGEMLEFSKAIETNVSLVELDLRENRLPEGITKRLKRTMEEKRSVVPLPTELKYAFLLCNRQLPHSQQLPEVMCIEVSSLFSDGSSSPLSLIFQFCALPRILFLDEHVESDPTHPRPALPRLARPEEMWGDDFEESDSEPEDFDDSDSDGMGFQFRMPIEAQDE